MGGSGDEKAARPAGRPAADDLLSHLSGHGYHRLPAEGWYNGARAAPGGRWLQIANYESPRTTKLYDRTNDAISLDEIERILI